DPAGVSGNLDEYTMYGDVAEEINLGIFNVYNGVDGTGAGDMEAADYDTGTVSGSNVPVDAARSLVGGYTVETSVPENTPMAPDNAGVVDGYVLTSNDDGTVSWQVGSSVLNAGDLTDVDTTGVGEPDATKGDLLKNYLVYNSTAKEYLADVGYVHPSGDGNKHVPSNSTPGRLGKVLTSTDEIGVYSWAAPQASSDGLVDGDFNGSSVLMKTDGNGTYSVDTTTYATTDAELGDFTNSAGFITGLTNEEIRDQYEANDGVERYTTADMNTVDLLSGTTSVNLDDVLTANDVSGELSSVNKLITQVGNTATSTSYTPLVDGHLSSTNLQEAVDALDVRYTVAEKSILNMGLTADSFSLTNAGAEVNNLFTAGMSTAASKNSVYIATGTDYGINLTYAEDPANLIEGRLSAIASVEINAGDVVTLTVGIKDSGGNLTMMADTFETHIGAAGKDVAGVFELSFSAYITGLSNGDTIQFFLRSNGNANIVSHSFTVSWEGAPEGTIVASTTSFIHNDLLEKNASNQHNVNSIYTGTVGNDAKPLGNVLLEMDKGVESVTQMVGSLSSAQAEAAQVSTQTVSTADVQVNFTTIVQSDDPTVFELDNGLSYVVAKEPGKYATSGRLELKSSNINPVVITTSWDDVFTNAEVSTASYSITNAVGESTVLYTNMAIEVTQAMIDATGNGYVELRAMIRANLTGYDLTKFQTFVTANVESGGASGTTDHNLLTNRDIDEQHTYSSIWNGVDGKSLVDDLALKADYISDQTLAATGCLSISGSTFTLTKGNGSTEDVTIPDGVGTLYGISNSDDGVTSGTKLLLSPDSGDATFVELIGGTNVTVTSDDSDTITFSATDTKVTVDASAVQGNTANAMSSSGAWTHANVNHAPSNAEANVDGNWNASSGEDGYIANKPDVRKNNLASSDEPTVDDGVLLGYGNGSIWIDISTDTYYVCVDAAEGAAVWNTDEDTSYTLYPAEAAVLGGVMVPDNGGLAIDISGN
ncbi:MAG: hypothetical protein DRP93_07320, partial [Candidatus Neomarinimicrobiota bacterium]